MRKSYDKPFLVAVVILVLFGIFALASASLGLVAKDGSTIYQYLSRQVILGLGVGGVLFLIAMKVQYKFWRRVALPFFLVSIALMLLVFNDSIGFSHGGARRWINFGYFFFQPAELLKCSFFIYLASWMSSRKEDITSFKFGFMPFVLMLGFVSFLFVMQPDVGTLMVIVITAWLVFFLGGGRVSQLGLLVLIGLFLLAFLIWLEPYRLDRVLVFMNPEYDLQGAGYQLHQSLIAIGSGGLFGRGFGMSVQKFNYLPEVMGDSIFSVISEEFGFVGAAFLVFLFIFFLFRGLKIAKVSPDVFGRLLGAGFVILITVQSFINMAALTGLMPLTGLPLVFISQGGSSLAISLFEAGILLNISKHAKT